MMHDGAGRNRPRNLKKQITICSWNVRGVKDKVKRQAILSMIDKGRVEILCLQETHLDKDSIKIMDHKKFQIQYHSTHSSFSRGVSILIKSGLAFSCSQSKVDIFGRYIFLYCSIENRKYVLANIYIPPPIWERGFG